VKPILLSGYLKSKQRRFQKLQWFQFKF